MGKVFTILNLNFICFINPFLFKLSVKKEKKKSEHL